MGSVLGGLLVIYLLSKLIEWVILKRVMRNRKAMTFISAFAVFFLILALWIVRKDQPEAFHPSMFIDLLIAATLLPILRNFWHKRRLAKASAASAAI